MIDDMAIPCDMALDEFKRTRKNVVRFWNLLYAASAATVVTVIFCMIGLIIGDDVTAIVGGVSTIATGGGIATVLKLKDSAIRELRAAQKAVRSDCVGKITGSRRLDTPQAEISQLEGVVDRLTDL